MPWKINSDGQIEVRDGNPVWVQDDGTEGVVQGNAISRLNAEAKQLRERAEKAEAAAKAFEGLDPAAAKDALEKLGKIDAKSLIDAGQVDKLKADLTAQANAKIATLEEQLASSQSKINDMIRANAFANSSFVNERLAIPRDIAEAYFGKHFKVEEGKLVAYGSDGQPLGSRKNFGANADVDEALELLISGRADKDQLLKSAVAGGSGATGAAGRGGSGAGRITRGEFEKLGAVQQAAAAKQMSEGKLEIVD